MTRCPTGWTQNDAQRVCVLSHNTGDVLSSVNFLDSDTQFPFMATYNGRWEAPLLAGRHPVLMASRGLYFDGNDDYMRLYDFRFSHLITIHVWVHVFEERGHLFALETATPKRHGLGDQELAIAFKVKDDGSQIIYGKWQEEEPEACSCAFLNQWKILTFQFENSGNTGST